MKSYIFCFLFICGELLSAFSYSQESVPELQGVINSKTDTNFSPRERLLINQMVKKLLDYYVVYNSFTKDTRRLDESYMQSYSKLFTDTSILIVNDIDPERATESMIHLSAYFRYVKSWYPTGLSVQGLWLTQKTPPYRFNNKVFINTPFRKSVNGLYADEKAYDTNLSLQILIGFDKSLNNPKIFRIRTREMDSIIHDGYKRFADKDYSNALSDFDRAEKSEPDEIEFVVMKDKCYKIINPPKIPYKSSSFYLDVHYIPGLSYVRFTGTSNGENPVTTTEMSSGFGVGIEYSIINDKDNDFRFGLALDYVPYNYNLSLAAYLDTIPSVDKDGANVNILTGLQNISEEMKIITLEIPVYLLYHRTISSKFGIYGRIGFKPGITLSSKYISNTTGEYKGQYPDLNNIILFGSTMEDYGYGKYEVRNDGTNAENITKFMLSGFAGVGADYQLTNYLSIFAGISYSFGLLKHSKVVDNYHVSINHSDLRSLTGLGNLMTRRLAFEIGINIKLSN